MKANRIGLFSGKLMSNSITPYEKVGRMIAR